MGQGNAKVGRLKYKDLDGNGVIDGKDRTILGSFIPKATACLLYTSVDISTSGRDAMASS